MAKFDHKASLPSALAQRGWAGLSISNSEYVVGPLEVYKEIESSEEPLKVKYFAPPAGLETLSGELRSESDAILMAHASGILDDFIGESTTFTTFGRMRTDRFDFTIRNQISGSSAITVDGTQVEIDGGFEGESTFTLIEAKNHGCDDFNIRQLYYPYRLWSSRVSKVVVPVFMTYTNETYELLKYDFSFYDDFNSAVLVERAKYTTVDTQISLQYLFEIARASAPTASRDVTFPQADNFERVIDLVQMCGERPLNKTEIAQIYNFDLRQAGYYSSAAKFLDLLDEVNGRHYQSPLARSIFSQPANAKYKSLAELVLRSRPIAQTFLDGNEFSRGKFSKERAGRFLAGSAFGAHLSESTLERRAKTIVDWCRWLDGLARY